MAVLLKELMMQTTALGDDGVQTVRYWLYAPAGAPACGTSSTRAESWDWRGVRLGT